MKYTVDYFIGKFEAIPEHLFTTCKFEFMGARCMIGHTMDLQTIWRVQNQEWVKKHLDAPCLQEARALCELVANFFNKPKEGSNISYLVNNGEHPDYQQKTPKKRVLALLSDIKKSQKPTERIV